MDITEETLLKYLQSQLDDFEKEKALYGPDDRCVNKKFTGLIANKEMVEAIIGKPVNLGKDGKVTVGLMLAPAV